MTRKILPAVLIIAVTAAVIVLLNVFKPGITQKQPAPAPAVLVAAVTAQKQSYTVELQSQGIVEASTRASLAAQVSGNVIERAVGFERGGYFRQGDVLLALDDRDYVAALKLALANESKARVSVEEEQARSQQAITDWNRLGYGTEPSDFVARKPQLAAARAELESAQAQVTKAELDLSRTKVRAPFDGRVIDNAIDVGNYVTPGTALGDIVATGKLKVALPVSASMRHLLDWPPANNRVSLTLPSAGNTRWQANVAQASADISRDSRQFHLIAYIDQPLHDNGTELLIGDYVSASIGGRRFDDVFVLPRSAINNGRFVWLIEQGRLQKQAVNVLWANDETVLIDSGLSDGQQVNITPLGAVVSGTKVAIQSNANGEATP
jgi:RND family efflux transporter MFP subunit